MSLKELLSKATVASVVAGICVVGGLLFAIATRNVDLVTFLAGAGVGYLFKTVVR